MTKRVNKCKSLPKATKKRSLIKIKLLNTNDEKKDACCKTQHQIKYKNFF